MKISEPTGVNRELVRRRLAGMGLTEVEQAMALGRMERAEAMADLLAFIFNGVRRGLAAGLRTVANWLQPATPPGHRSA